MELDEKINVLEREKNIREKGKIEARSLRGEEKGKSRRSKKGS